MKTLLDWIIVSILLGRLECQLTSITLSPSVFNLDERHRGNFNLSIVTLDPPTAPASCYISQVGTDVTPPSPTFTAHPFDKSFNMISPDIVQWYFFYDSTSPNKPDYNVYKSYNVTVECSTGTPPSRQADFFVNILSNQPPVIQDAPRVDRDLDAKLTKKGDLLYTVVASDADGDPITYKFTVNPPEDIFTINGATKEISAKVDFIGVGESPITLTLEVSDGENTAKLDIVFNISNRNARPEITNLPNTLTVPENSDGGTELFVLTYYDPDQTSLFVPDCLVTPVTAPPVFNITGSRISLSSDAGGKSLLDYENVQTYQIDCVINDQYLDSKGPDILTVSVSDVNESPVFNQNSYTCTLQESLALDSTCGLNLSVKDPDNQPVVVSIDQTANGQRFRFTSPTADRLTFSVDYDVDENAMPSNLTIKAIATDSAGLTSSAVIYVQVEDVNDNSPVISSNQVFTVQQADVPGVQGSVEARDKDSGENAVIEYRLIDTQPASVSQYFNINANGEISYITRFPDSLNNSTVLLTVGASDKGTPPRSDSGTITLHLRGDPAATPTPSNPSISGSTNEKRFFDEPANVAMVTVIGLIVFVALLVALYFCIKKMLLGYCCKKRNPTNVYPDYDHYGNYKRKIKVEKFNTKIYQLEDDYYDNRSMQANIG